MCNKRFFWVLSATMFFFSASCVPIEGPEDRSNNPSHNSDSREGNTVDSRGFKIPLPKDFDWEITQSWWEHCSHCNQFYFDWDYCSSEMSHSGNCCKYAWDFNLPGSEDRGKPVLASSDGVVYDVDYSDKWGNYVVIDHGNVCTRYAHMLDGSISHISYKQEVCQGLKIGEIGNTGIYSKGDHLHFQFEECGNDESIEWRFTDGNNVPKCTRSDDRYDSQGEYTALKLTNRMVYSCKQSGDTFGGGQLPDGGWIATECGSLPGCPLIPNCGRAWGHEFTDHGSLSSQVAEASAYLYSECALDGKADGGLHPSDKLTRAEALKVPMFLYGLMDNCGASEPFADVDQDDWYFEVVACAIQHQIITFADYFHPNDDVKFSEAAKFVVEAASRAKVIQIQDPSHAHFPNISKTHWAYEYVETIYYYGGLDSSALNFGADQKIDRGDYFIMVASLSPCYCRNVDCESGCQCDQSVFACVNPNDTSSGTGGGGDEEFVPDVSIECSVDSEDTQCIDPDTVLQIECDVTNNGDEVVKVTDLHLVMTDPTAASVCQVTDDAYRTNVGYNSVSPGESRRISGHFDITCLERPSDGGIDVSLDLTHSVVGSSNLVFTDVARTTIAVPTAPFADCYCDGRECGSDSNGGSCGSCGSNETCDYANGQCVPDCVPNCVDRECGPDSCGGSCGSCGSNETCDNVTGQCDSDLDYDPDTCTCPANYTPDDELGCLACGEPGTCNSPCCVDAPMCWVQEVRVALPSGGTVYVQTGAGAYTSVIVPPGQYLQIGLVASDLGASFWCSTSDISVEAIKGTMYAWFPGVMYPQPFVGPGQLVSKFDLVNSPGSHANWRLL